MSEHRTVLTPEPLGGQNNHQAEAPTLPRRYNQRTDKHKEPMQAKAKKPCRECGRLVDVDKPPYCDEHRKAKTKQYDANRTTSEYRKEYRTKRWADYRRRFASAQDWQCQRLDEFDGTRCEQMGNIVHHRRHPECGEGEVNYDLFYDPTNTVLCCPRHHDAGAKGDTGTERWAPTNTNFDDITIV